MQRRKQYDEQMSTKQFALLGNHQWHLTRALTRVVENLPWRPVRLGLVPWLLALVLLVGPNSPFALAGADGIAFAQGLTTTAAAQGQKGTPNTFGAYLQKHQAHAGQTTHIAQASAGGPVVKAGTAASPTPPQRPYRPSMKPGTLALTPGQAAHFTGSDGVLRVDVPASAVSAADVAAGGGTLSLRITQVAGGSGSTAGGSGEISLGTYLIQVLDAHGNRPSFGLRQPITISYTYSAHEQNLPLDKTVLVINGPRPAALALAPLAPATASPAPTTTPTTIGSSAPTVLATGSATTTATTTATPSAHSTTTPSATASTTGTGNTSANGGWGASATVPTTLDTTQRTISGTATLTASTATADFNTFSPVATFGSPDPFTADLSGGGLDSSIPINVPGGPGGLTPPVNLAYSSAAVSEQHNVQAAAGWVGEGWSMSLGAVTWAEHNVTADCSSCNANWENSWQISDPYGMGSNLIPPNNSVSTYYDETNNTYFNGTSYFNMPAQWHTSAENYAKIVSYVGPNTLQTQAAKPPCFRAWLTNGIMEEFGCTTNSLAFYETSSGDRITAWNLDLITDPQGNQIHITYQADTTPGYPRDMELATIQYDSPGCHNANTACTGSAWAPRVQITFAASHSPTRLTGTAPTGCNTGTNMRCDDPVSLSYEPAPSVQSTYVLNDIKVQVSPSGNNTWSLLRDYQLSYQQTGPHTYVDQNTGHNFSTAGELLLTTLRLADENDATTASMPPETFGYGYAEQYYEDSSYYSYPGECGWTWNEPGGSTTTCPLWSVNRAGNGYLLTSADNGLGLHSTFTWVPGGGHNNTHGVNSGSISDPTTCNNERVQGTVCALADDQNWSRAILQSRTDTVNWISQAGQGGTQTSTPETSTTNYTYALTHLTALQCPNCTYGYDWGNENNGDYQDYYDVQFMGFAETDVTNPDGSVVKHHYISTEGFGIYDSTVGCYAENGYKCYYAPWWHLANAGHGHETEIDTYDTNGTTLLTKTTADYYTTTVTNSGTQNATCPPSGASATPAYEGVTWDGQLVAMLDHNNPIAVCDVQQKDSTTTTYDGGSSTATMTTTTTYDTYGRVATTSTTVNGGSPTTINHHDGYTQNSAVSTSEYSASGTYLIDFPSFKDTEDTASPANRWSCTYTNYDGAGYTPGQTSSLKYGEPSETDTYTTCGTSPNYTAGGTDIATKTGYDSSGNPIGTVDADAAAGISGHLGCSVNSIAYTNCTAYDSLYNALPTSSTNALDQTATIGYTNSSAGGYGQWPTSATDPNNQTTSTAYDTFGRAVSTTLPGETSGDTTTSVGYSVTCPTTGAQTPCAEEDSTQRLSSSTTVTVQHFYDGFGREVETVTPAPGGQYVAQYTYYDPTSGQIGFESQPYYVASSGWSIPDSTQPGTSYSYDALGRLLTSENALSQTTTTSYSITCLTLTGLASNGCYEQTTIVDANNHETATLADALGRTAATETFTGNSQSTYTLYQQTVDSYDEDGHLTSILQPDGTSKTTYTYDLAGRKTGMSDPDRGSESYSYDPNGNLTESVDARGASGTIYAGYDGLNRQLWRNTTNSPTGATVTYTYDSTANGNDGIGRRTGETFIGGPNNGWTGSYSTVYDPRGEVSSTTETLNGTSYPTSMTYDDAGHVLSQTYPDGEVVATGYSAQGWMNGLATTFSGQGATTLVDNMQYSGAAGALGDVTSYGLGPQGGTDTYTTSLGYDALGRVTDSKTTLVSTDATLFETTPSYDAVGNVVSIATTLPGGTDNQAFCYDELNRLTWAGSMGTPPCTGSGISAGTLTSAQYTAGYSYDTLGRLTGSPLGTYTYGDSAHLHGATSVGSSWTGTYDAAGDLTCRAATDLTTCAGGTPTGAQLSYDAAGQLSHWQNAPTLPTSTADYLYDGEGNRVLAQTSGSGGAITTTTAYVSNLEDVTTTAGASPTTTTTAYYYLASKRVALSVNGTISYLTDDQLGSAEVALSASGSAEASQLYDPYGNTRYSSGAMPGSYGYAGQRDDTALTGLDYDTARYYDPTIGQFTSADTVADGLNRYGYVGGNPETKTDPTGHCFLCSIVSAVTSTVSSAASTVSSVAQAVAPVALQVVGTVTGVSSMITDVQTIRQCRPARRQPADGGAGRGGSRAQRGDGCLDAHGGG